jgi:predicted RNase H-like nuclease (RuvC/YqgF family)
VQDWIMTSPVEVINKFTVDPAMEKVFEKHDTSQDAKIIVQINERIQSLKNENQALIDEVKYLQKEIDKLNKKLK